VQGVEVEVYETDGKVELFSTLDLTAGAETQASAMDLWRRIISGTSSGSSVGGGTGAIGVISSPTPTVVTAAPSAVYLGGSRGDAVPSTGGWVDVAHFVEMPIDATQYPGGLARVVLDLWTADGSSVKARLWCAASSVSAGESASVSQSTPTDATFAVTLTGTRRYRLQVYSASTGKRLFCQSGGLIA
jgi:hypothetical protein